MLQITIPAGDMWDEEKEEFITLRSDQKLQLEHSLVSLSKWESKWCKPFLKKENKTTEETIDYVRCMTVTQNVDPKVYLFLTNKNYKEINDYVDSPMTATWFTEDKKGKPNREQITSELIYYWMIALNIPFECQKWHLNRLLTLIRVCNVKNQPPKKMSKRDIMSHNRALNAARRKRLNTKG
jgi:hypothetical protein